MKRAAKVIPFPTDPVESASLAGLRYTRTDGRGIRRVRTGKSFRYVAPDGKPVTDEATLRRIRSLVIPPAWTDVWICPSANGHLQAIGRDAKGRKQYRYHPYYRQVRDQTKFGRMAAFGEALPKIRQRVEDDLHLPGLPKNKVVGAVVKLLEQTSMRVGNDEYAKENGSYGLTTLRDKHVDINGSKMRFNFKGKSGQLQDIELDDPRLAKIVKKCRDIPGYELFQYIDADGNACRVDSSDVNEYIRELTGEDFTAKDFRTWGGTGLAALTFEELGAVETASDAKKQIVECIKRVSKQLGNRPATCRKYYVHPAVIEAYTDGSLFEALRSCQGVRRQEACILSIIGAHLEKLSAMRQDLTPQLKASIQKGA